jgi:hypothetical protein
LLILDEEFNAVDGDVFLESLGQPVGLDRPLTFDSSWGRDFLGRGGTHQFSLAVVTRAFPRSSRTSVIGHGP